MTFTSLSFTTKYIIALSTIAIFSILAYINLTSLTNSQEDDGEIINISGRQRMLSQKIALFAVTGNSKNLKTPIILMENSHKLLLTKHMSKELEDIYFNKPLELDKRVKEYLVNAREFSKNQSKDSLNYILSKTELLLEDLDYVTSIYQDNSDLKVEELQLREQYIVLLTLLTLLLEAVFIFFPVNRMIKKKTVELSSQNDYLDVITNINTNAIIAVDQNFLIKTFNKSAQNMFGYTENEMLNTKLLDSRIIPQEYLGGHINGIKTFMKTGQLKNKNVVFELIGKNKDGDTFPIKISFGINIDKKKKIVVANIQNITKEKEKDALIMQQSRSAAMGEMIGNIAHQWRQPLSSISAIATGAKLRYKNNLITDDELDETFIKIKEHTLYLSQTIDDFRDFFKDEQNVALFNVVDVINKTITLTEASYRDNKIKVIIDSKIKSLDVNGSASKLSQVFLNILHNAKDVLIEKNIENRIVFVEIEDIQDGYVVVKIQDNAGGVPDNIITKVFDPYFTTKHKSQGTGIGLFMSKKIILKHFHGNIEVRNRKFTIDDSEFYGAEFTIRIKQA